MRTTIRRKLVAATLTASALAVGAVAVPTAGAASTISTTKQAKKLIVNPGTTSVSETGSSLLYPLFNIWVPAYNEKFSGVTITTASTGSGTGVTDATNGTVDIGASDAYLSPEEKSASPHLENIPLAISAQLIAYNVPGVTAHLHLSGKLLSEIYQGKITNWNDPAIAKANPGITLPDLKIVTLHRSDGSGDTFLFTQYLSKADPNGWGKSISYGTTVAFPNISGALGENGNSGMVTGCTDTKGCVAYIGISYLSQVLQGGLGEAALQNAKGHYVLPTAGAIKAESAGFVKKTPSSGTISLIYGPAANGYPIINYEYGIVSTDQQSSSTAKAIRSVLAWAVDPSNGNNATYLSQVNFQPLPSKVAGQSLKQIAKIK